jgi:hypothetical protein
MAEVGFQVGIPSLILHPLGKELREVFGSSHSLRLSVKSHECIGMVEFGDGEITPLEAQLVRVLRVDSSTGHLARTL